MGYQGGLFLSKKEQMLYLVIEDVRQGKLSRREAALKLGVSERTIQRKIKRIREQGIAGIKHGNSGKTPHNKISSDVVKDVIDLYKNKYFDFNFSHAHEFLSNHHGVTVSYSSFRKWCRTAGLGKFKKRRANKRRLAREREANEGLTLQLDGSPDKWNGKDTWSLISFIDDATSDIPHAEFHPTETTWGCLGALKRVIEKRGIPEFIVTDRAGWSRGSAKRNQFSQFVRACEELGIKVVAVSSPEAKGRVERSFRTCQDRLIPEFRLKGIKTIADANRYLEQVYLPEWRKKRTVEPRGSSRYREVPEGLDLKEVLCLKVQRTVRRDHTITYRNREYRIDEPSLGVMWKKAVSIHIFKDGAIAVYYGRRKLTIKPFNRPRVRSNRKWA